MKTKDIRNQSPEELNKKIKDLNKELFDLNYQRKMGQVEKPSKFKTIRKDIARILTILNERKKDGTRIKNK